MQKYKRSVFKRMKKYKSTAYQEGQNTKDTETGRILDAFQRRAMSKSSLVYETYTFEFEIFIFAFESSRILDAFQRLAILKFLAFFITSELRLPKPPSFYILEIAILIQIGFEIGKYGIPMHRTCSALTEFQLQLD